LDLFYHLHHRLGPRTDTNPDPSAYWLHWHHRTLALKARWDRDSIGSTDNWTRLVKQAPVILIE
jgi:hypothetical protein